MEFVHYLINQLALPPNIIAEVDKIFWQAIFEDEEFLLKEGEIADKLFFVEEGILREFSYKETETETETETELTHWLVSTGEWICQLKSFDAESPSESGIQSHGRSRVRYITKTTLNTLCAENVALAPKIIGLMIKYLAQLERHSRLYRQGSVAKRLENLERLQPELARNVPLHIIASFLNTTPQNLSRVRSKRAKRK